MIRVPKSTPISPCARLHKGRVNTAEFEVDATMKFEFLKTMSRREIVFEPVSENSLKHPATAASRP